MRALATLLALAILLACTTSRADVVVAPGRHASRLTSSTTVGSQMGVVEGAPPSRQHPRGTVIVAWSLQQRGPTLTEWDLAHETIVRQVSLGWGEAEVRIARAGGILHVLVMHDTFRVGYARVDGATLRVVCRAELGHGNVVDVAGDETFAAAGWADQVDALHDPLFHLSLLDSSCAATTIAPGGLAETAPEVRQIAVLGPRFYVAMQGPRPRVLAFSRSGALEGQLALPPSDHPVALITAGTRLVASTFDELLEVSPNLSIVGRHPYFLSRMMAVARDGHLLTDPAEVLSTSFAVERRMRTSRMWVHDVTWVGDIPVSISTEPEPSSTVILDWLEPTP